MQTPTVQNQSNVTSSSPQGAKSQNTSDVPFNQMLSQQISSSKASESNQANDTSKVNDTNKASDTTQAGNGNADSVSKQSASADATDTKVSGKDKTKETDDASKTDASAAVPVSAELMALVANHLNQANAKPVDTSVTTTDAKAAADATDALSLKADARASLAQSRTAANAKDILSNETDTKTATDKTQITELTGKGSSSKAASNFTATMSAIEQTADSKQAATAKLQDALSAIPTGATSQLQQTALNLAQAAASQPTDKLTPQVGSPAWDQALGQKVVWMVAGSQQSAALTLNPPDLGPLHVVLHVSNGQADASFTASQPEVRQALEAAMPKLREMMSDAGIQLGQATIGTGMPNQQNRSGESSGQNSRGFGQSNDSADTTTRITGTTKITGGQGLVDTFA